MSIFSLTPESLRQSAQKIENEALNYENASKVAMMAADELKAGWEGNAQKTFASEQENAKMWYLKMAEISRQYAAALRAAAAEYERADAESATAIASR